MTGNTTTAAGDTTNGLIWLTPAILYTSLLMLIGACGNAFVCYVYGFRWQRTVTKIFIFSLAALDLMNSVICMPTEIAMLVKIVSFDAPDWCRITRFLTYTLNGSSSLILVAIALDRYYKIHKPLGCFFTDRRAKQTCVLAVFVAAALSSPSLVFYGNLALPIAGSDDMGVTCLVSDDYIDTWWPLAFYSAYFACYLALVVAITVLYSLIARKLVVLRRKQKDRLQMTHAGLRNSAALAHPDTIPLKIIIDDDRGFHENDVINLSRVDSFANATETVNMAPHFNVGESGKVTSSHAVTDNGDVRSADDLMELEKLQKGAELNRTRTENRRRISVTFKLPFGVANTDSFDQRTSHDSDALLSETGNERSAATKADSRMQNNEPRSLDTESEMMNTQSVEIQCKDLKYDSFNTENNNTDGGAPTRKIVLKMVGMFEPVTHEDRKRLDPPQENQTNAPEASSKHSVNTTASSDNSLQTKASPENPLADEPLFSSAEGHLFPVEKGARSRNSLLMPAGGYPGGRTPTSRLPTPTDTPNPDASVYRPVPLSTALLLDRLSKKMAYRPAKTTRMLFAISIVFVVSFLPFFVVVLMRAVQGRAFLAAMSNVHVVIVSIFIRSSFISNAANPVIYGLCNKQFRVECRQLLKRFSGRKSETTVRVLEQTDDALGCANSS